MPKKKQSRGDTPSISNFFAKKPKIDNNSETTESGGPVTIDSEVGNYVSASEDHPISKNITVATTSTSGEASLTHVPQPLPQFFNYNQTLNTTSAEVTLVPQHDSGVTRVSNYFICTV